MKAIYRAAMFVSVIAVFSTVLMGWSETALATSGRCTLQVDGKVYLNGMCNIEMEANGSFSIGMGDTTRSKYFASVDIDSATGVAHGMWNGKDADSHAHDDLGALKRKGACWVNQRAKVCAIAEREQRSSSVNSFECSQ